MSPRAQSREDRARSAPRVSGDEPGLAKNGAVVLECSPRERG